MEDFFVILKMIFLTVVQIELSPIVWLEIGLNPLQSYLVVTTISLIMLMVHVWILEAFVSVLGINRTRIGHRIARVMHKWGLFGLFLAGITPWFVIIGVAQPVVYILYCESEYKIWYKPNLGLLSMGVGIATKMIFFV